MPKAAAKEKPEKKEKPAKAEKKEKPAKKAAAEKPAKKEKKAKVGCLDQLKLPVISCFLLPPVTTCTGHPTRTSTACLCCSTDWQH